MLRLLTAANRVLRREGATSLANVIIISLVSCSSAKRSEINSSQNRLTAEMNSALRFSSLITSEIIACLFSRCHTERRTKSAVECIWRVLRRQRGNNYSPDGLQFVRGYPATKIKLRRINPIKRAAEKNYAGFNQIYRRAVRRQKR